MDALFQRLKELAPDRFEHLTFDLLKERHPGVPIHHVDGKGGDEGVDHFTGDLASGSTVWQVKALPDGIKAAQKEQIKKSLARVLGTCNPKQWILCVNIDLDTKTHRWLQQLQKQHPSIRMGLLSAGDIVHELLHRRTLREQYFPGASLDPTALRALMTRTGELTIDELATLTEENVTQYLARLQDRDARFHYELAVRTDQAPAPDPPGTIFTIKKDQTLIRASPRDHEALRQAPPTVNFTATSSAGKKLADFLATGRQQHFDNGDLLSLTTDLPLDFTSAAEATLDLIPRPSAKVLPLRLMCGNAPHAITYQYVPFLITRSGTKEVELTSTGHLPFTASIIIRDDHTGTINFTEHALGADVCDVRQFMDAMHAVKATHYIEAYNLETGKRLLRATTNNASIPDHWERGFETFVRMAATVADAFTVTLRLPNELTSEAEHALQILHAITTGTTVTVSNLTIDVTKCAANGAHMRGTLSQDTTNIQQHEPDYTVQLFGTTISVGHVTLTLPSISIKDRAATLERWEEAHDGDTVTISFDSADGTITRNRRDTPE